jgi:hypothetical protein
VKQFFKILIERWKAPTEKWFKSILNIGLWITGLASALLAAPTIITGFTLPDVLYKPCQWLAVAGVVMSFVAKTSSTEHK